MPPSDPAMNQTSFRLKRGLAEFGYPDHYAVLGLEVDATAGEIRKRYMQLARLLHPDSCSEEINKTLASQFLSKLVNPAYQVLSQEKERADYSLLLKLVGQRANLEFDVSRFTYQPAQEVLKIETYEESYRSTLQSLIETQYLQLDQSLACIELLSELNLAFLLRRETTKSRAGAQPSSSSSNYIPAEPSSPEISVEVQAKAPRENIATPSENYVKQYIRRAEELIAKNLFPSAIQELRDALKIEPQNGRCHCLMGIVYLRQNQPKMAKGHLTQALKVEPENAEALEWMNKLKKLEAHLAKTAQPTAKTTQPGANTTERRGLFRLFGGKK
jgi:curved DNA-binding protein CbpA